MPVPVPRVVTPTPHPVIKRPCGAAPPVQSTPWKNGKPRRIWEEETDRHGRCEGQGFRQGLTIADNAMVIKGLRAQAWLPPKPNTVEQNCPGAGLGEEHNLGILRWQEDYPASGNVGDVMDVEEDPVDTSPALVFTALATFENKAHRYGPYCPVYEEHSPGTDSGPEADSSPLEPITPFADFIDRAVAVGQPLVAALDESDFHRHIDHDIVKQRHAPVFPTLAETARESAPAPDIVTPTASSGYRQLAQPLSEWLANYVWRACTTGLSLSPVFTQSSSRAVHYPPIPPSYLAPSIHALLLSTLLQPSAIFLGLWYIIRLPGYFNAAELGPEYPKEGQFRNALLGDLYGYDREALELNAPFRLVVLGCMLANKWLDDHTFSNKTWNSVSNVPVQELNRLEALALDVFSYDLSISNSEWSQWMSHLKSYHMSLAPSHLQPIGRPSSNPHSIIRQSIDEIVQAPSTTRHGPLPQPVFLGIDERKKRNLEREHAAMEILEINLDEDGPLREEYLPRRRSTVTNTRAPVNNETHDPVPRALPGPDLPPPAKWSPEGDEPILRDRNRSSGQYVAVQAAQVNPYAVAYASHDASYGSSWDIVSFGNYPKPIQTSTCGFAPAAFQVNPCAYNPYPQLAAIGLSHSRSQSMFYDADATCSRHHPRSYSQSGLHYKCSDAHMLPMVDYLATIRSDQQWVDPGHYAYPGTGAIYGPSIASAPTSWLRA